MSRRSVRAIVAVAALSLLVACEKKRSVGEPCRRNDACESGICSHGVDGMLGGPVCTQACRGVGPSTCPTGWTCAGAASELGRGDAPTRSVCVPRESVEPGAPRLTPTERILVGETGTSDVDELRRGAAGKYLPPASEP